MIGLPVSIKFFYENKDHSCKELFSLCSIHSDELMLPDFLQYFALSMVAVDITLKNNSKMLVYRKIHY